MTPSQTLAPKLVLDRFMPYRLSITANLVGEAIARAYGALFGLTIPEWRVIAVTAERAPITQVGIGTATRMDKVTVSRATIALVSRGLLARQPNPGDRRSQWLALSATGRALYEAVVPQAQALEAAIFADFTPADIAALGALLDRIDAAVMALARRDSVDHAGTADAVAAANDPSPR